MAQHKMLAALVVLAFASGAAAHGGILHEWPATPTGSNYIRTKIASCSNWKPADGQVANSLVNSTAAAATTTPIFRGDATVWSYLYGNCSVAPGEAPSAGVEFNVTVTNDGKPVGNLTLDGVAMTGSCASGGGSPYYFNLTATPIDDKHNILWFHNYTTTDTGRIHGNGANDGYVYTTGDHSVKSIMIRNTDTLASLACCDLTIAGAPNTDWAATLEGKGKQCDAEGGDSTTTAAATADDHADHDHSNMTDAAAAAANATAKAASAAGGVAAGLFGAAVAVVVSVLAVV